MFIISFGFLLRLVARTWAITIPITSWITLCVIMLTLALDFPNIEYKTLELFALLDSVVKYSGGRIYLAKDMRMGSEIFRAGYPNLSKFMKYKDPQFSSNLWRRVML